jgi:hypothetical protein
VPPLHWQDDMTGRSFSAVDSRSHLGADDRLGTVCASTQTKIVAPKNSYKPPMT